MKKDDFSTQGKTQAEGGKNSKLGGIFLMLLFGSVCVVWIVSGLWGLFFAPKHAMEDVFGGAVLKDKYEGEIKIASARLCSLEHKINGLIPTGTEHFFLIYAEDMSSAVFVRADKSWDDTFTSDLYNAVSINGRGIVRKMDYKVQNEMSQFVTLAAEAGMQIQQGIYIDLVSDRMCWLQLIDGILLTLCIIYFYFYFKHNPSGNHTTGDRVSSSGRPEVQSDEMFADEPVVISAGAAANSGIWHNRALLSFMTFLFLATDVLMLYLLSMISI